MGRPGASGPLDILVIGMHYVPEYTGNAPVTTGMVQGLAAAGHRVRVITGYPHYPAWRVHDGYTGLRRREVIGGVEVLRVRHPVPSTPDALRRTVMDAVFTVHAAAQRGPRPDVVIAVSPLLLTVAAGLRWRRAGRTALGVVAHDLYGRALSETGMTSARIARWGARLEAELLRRADGVAVVHDHFVRPVIDLGVEPRRVRAVPNWTHVAAGGADRETVRAELGWRPDEVIALHAGNMGIKQGLENAVCAARHADAVGSSVRVVLLGDGHRRHALLEAGRGVERLTFLDPLPDARFADTLAAADVLVVNEAATVAEMSAPSKLTSYFAAGRPVVAASWPRSAASAEIERSGGGVRIDPGDPTALHDTIAALAADPVRAEGYATAGLTYSAERLAPAAALAGYRAWVEELAAGRRARA